MFQVPTRAEGPRRDVEQKITEIFAFNQGLFFSFDQGPKKLFHLIRAYFLRLGHVFRPKLMGFKIHYQGPKKPFHLIMAYFLRLGHVFRPKLTGFKIHYQGRKKLLCLIRAYFLNSIFYLAFLLGVFGLRWDLNSKTKVQSPISKLLAWTL